MAETVRPDHWPKNVQPISFDNLGKLGVNPQNNRIYWDGQELVTANRLDKFERFLAVVVASSSFAVAVVMVGQAMGRW